MKNNLTYYQHYSNAHNDPKFQLLRSLYGGGEEGWAAEGKFWALSDMIAASEQCILQIHKKYVRASICIGLNFTGKALDVFISRLTECELIINIDGNITTETIRENLSEVLKNRERARKNRLSKKNKSIEPLLFSLKNSRTNSKNTRTN
jgi:hypothetical protein